MEKREETAPRFFSVSKELEFNGRVYRPTICYEITGDIRRVVYELAETGRAVLHIDRVRFMNGVVQQNAVQGAQANTEVVVPPPMPRVPVDAGSDEVPKAVKKAQKTGQEFGKE